MGNHVKNSKSLSPKFSGVANRRSNRDWVSPESKTFGVKNWEDGGGGRDKNWEEKAKKLGRFFNFAPSDT